MSRLFFTILLIAISIAHPVRAAELCVLSAGALEPGVHAFAQQLKNEHGIELKIQFNTAPQIARRLAAGEYYDIMISPPAVIEQAIRDGKVLTEGRVRVGRVGAGVIVRRGNALPDISTLAALKKTLLNADALVYNSASTGLYLDNLFERIGILSELKAKTTRYPDGASVMEHVIKGTGKEIGFGAITEIALYVPKGLSYVGPLPADVQNYTNYDAALMNTNTTSATARFVLHQLSRAEAKAAFSAAGIETP